MNLKLVRHAFFFLCGGLLVAMFAITRIYGAEVAKELVPYFVAAPCAYVLVALIGIISRMQRAAKTSHERKQNFYAGTAGAGMVLLYGTAYFQPWLNARLWVILGLVSMLLLIVIAALIRNRLIRGAWLAKPRSSEK